MGRVKLEIKRIENSNNRLVTYAKRKAGLIKKAQELSTLCDIDVALIMFSPGNKLTQYATNSRIEDIILRYANVPEAERAKRKMENLEQLNRAIKKLKGETDTSKSRIPLHFKGDLNNIELVQEEIKRLQNEIDGARNKLRLYQGDDEILDSFNYEELFLLEGEILRVINKIHAQREMQASSMTEVGYGCNSWADKESEGNTFPKDMYNNNNLYSEDYKQLIMMNPEQATGPFLMPGLQIGQPNLNLENLACMQEEAAKNDALLSRMLYQGDGYINPYHQDLLSSVYYSQTNESNVQDSNSNIMELEVDSSKPMLESQ